MLRADGKFPDMIRTHAQKAARTPLHPMLVHFPLGFVLLAVAADVAFFFLKIESLRHVGWWSIAAAAVGGVFTAAAGVFDMRRASLEEEVHARVHRHMKVGFALLAAIGALAFWRWTIFIDRTAQVTAVYLDCAVLVMALAIFQGWLGGELVYSDGVFVKETKPLGGAKGRGGEGGHHH